MFGHAKRIAALELTLDAVRSTLADVKASIDKTSGAGLRVELNELAAALEALATSNRRELGKMWRVLGNEGKSSANGAASTSDEVAAFLALQSAPPVKPGA